MQGQVIHVAIEESDGFIRAEDSHRYAYAISDWISAQPATVGAIVDFELVENRAKMVCEVPQAIAVGSSSTRPVWKKGAFHAVAGALAVLVAGVGVAYKSGLWTAQTSESHGPVKTYQAQNLAKIRNKPTAQNSTVLGELKPGDNFVGRVYLAPDGQSQWIKRDGVDEYVSIVNLAEIGAPQMASTGTPQNSATNNLPQYSEVRLALMQSHSKNCEPAKVYSRSDTPWMPHSARLVQVINERDAIVKFLNSYKNAAFAGRNVATTLSATGEPMNFSMKYLIGSDMNPNVRDIFSFEQSKEVSQEGRLMSAAYALSACLYSPNSITIVDHEISKQSEKTASIRYQETFGPSNAIQLVNKLGSINPELSTVYITGPAPRMREGVATLHNNDATGWVIERDDVH